MAGTPRSLLVSAQAAYEDMPMYRNITTTDWSPFQYLGLLRTEDEEPCGPTRHEVKKERFQQLVARCDQGDRKLAIKKAKVKLR